MTNLVSKIIYDETFKFSKQNITYSFSKEPNESLWNGDFNFFGSTENEFNPSSKTEFSSSEQINCPF